MVSAIVFLIASGERRTGMRRRCLLPRRRIPHQPRVKGLCGEHRQDHDAAKRDGADAGLEADRTPRKMAARPYQALALVA